MEAHRYWEGAKATNGKGCSSKSGIEKRLYPLPTEVSFYPPRGNKFMDQSTKEEPYCQKGQYFNEIILKYDEKLDYQLFYSLDVIIGVLKLWLVEGTPCLLTEPYQKEHKGNFSQDANHRS